MDEKEKRVRQLRDITIANDSVLIITANYTNDDMDEVDIDFSVSADEDELFLMFKRVFKHKLVKDEARKAILYSDYGDKNIDSLN